MPTIFILFGYHFQFFSNDHEPIHVHVMKDGNEAKFNVLPEVELMFNHGYKKNELSMIESIVEENKDIIIERWRDFFDVK